MFNFLKKETSLDQESREAMVITLATVFALENIRNSNLKIENETVYQTIVHLYNQFQELFKKELNKVRKDKSNQKECILFITLVKDFLEKKFKLAVNIDPSYWLPTDEELYDEIWEIHLRILNGKKTLAVINKALGTKMDIKDIQ